MADATSSIFNKKAADKLRNPDDLERHIRVTNPSIWVVLGACAALLAGLLVWGFFGAVTTSVSATGSVVDGQAMCFLGVDSISKVTTDDTANFGGVSMRVSEVSEVPLSRDEAYEELHSDYLASALMPGDWAYQINFEGDASELTEGIPQDVSIMVERVSPISLILKGGE